MSFSFQELNEDGTNLKDNSGWTGDINKKCNSKELIGKSSHSNSKQSPINILTNHVQECHMLCNLDINYKPSKCHITKNPEGTIRLNWDPGSYITFNNMNYELKYIYFHTPSMHTIDNNSSEMEINLYHGLAEGYLPSEHNVRKDIDDESISLQIDFTNYEYPDPINTDIETNIKNGITTTIQNLDINNSDIRIIKKNNKVRAIVKLHSSKTYDDVTPRISITDIDFLPFLERVR